MAANLRFATCEYAQTTFSSKKVTFRKPPPGASLTGDGVNKLKNRAAFRKAGLRNHFVAVFALKNSANKVFGAIRFAADSGYDPRNRRG